MPLQTINIGASANDGTGDPLRTAMDKANDNFLALSGNVVNVKDPAYGAVGDDSTNDTVALQAAAAACGTGDVLYFPNGTYRVDSTIVIDDERIGLIGDGAIIAPHGSFSDWLCHIKIPGSARFVADLQGQAWISGIRFDGRWQSRGLKLTQIDCSTFYDLFISRAYGTAIKMDCVRESSFHGLQVVSCLHRDAFSDPSAWSSVTTYSVGDRVKYTYSNWSNATTYAANDYATGSDGRVYRSLVGSNLNEAWS